MLHNAERSRSKEQQMSDGTRLKTRKLQALVDRWFASFRAALSSRSFDDLDGLIHEDCYWRDLLTFGWKLQTAHPRRNIYTWLASSFEVKSAETLTLRGEVIAGRLGEVYPETVGAFFDFETSVAVGRGFVYLVVEDLDEQKARAVTLLTAMRELRQAPEQINRNRPRTGAPTGEEKDAGSASADPDVLVIGAGQAGLMAAARLGRMNVDTLVVDRMHRIGDNWRERYKWLTLHNTTPMNHFPYLPFPQSWPVYLPRDKVIRWLEFYAEAMDLRIATQTTCLGGSFDEKAGRWTIRLKNRDGEISAVTPRFVVLATGVAGRPNMPDVRGAETFRGMALHSSQVTDALDMTGKKVVVIGAGTSAHDIAQMGYLKGADVTLVQRSSITVVSLEPSAAMSYELFNKFDGVKDIDDVDLMHGSVPYDLVRRIQMGMSSKMALADEALLSRLRAVGFLLDNGEDDTGWIMKLLRYHAGYYLNIGASDLIADGKIGLKPGVGVAELSGNAVVFSDDSRLDADIVVFATGYRPVEDTVAQLFGDEIAGRVGKIFGIGPDDEVSNMYCATGQPNFFVTGGGFGSARHYSRYIALLIKASLLGVHGASP